MNEQVDIKDREEWMIILKKLIDATKRQKEGENNGES